MLDKAKRQAEALRTTAKLLEKEGITYFSAEKFLNVARLIESLAEQLETAQPKWISVEERLPEEGVTVLGAFLRYNGYEINITKYCVYPHRSVWFIGDMNSVGSTPTHWMPLPEPPKGD